MKGGKYEKRMEKCLIIKIVNIICSTTSNVEKTEVEEQLEPTDEHISDYDKESTYEDVLILENTPCSFTKKRTREKEDKLATILAKRAKKRSEMLEKIDEQNDLLIKHVTESSLDEIDLFCRSLAMSIKKLPARGINEAKVKLL